MGGGMINSCFTAFIISITFVTLINSTPQKMIIYYHAYRGINLRKPSLNICYMCALSSILK